MTRKLDCIVSNAHTCDQLVEQSNSTRFNNDRQVAKQNCLQFGYPLNYDPQLLLIIEQSQVLTIQCECVYK